MNDDLKTAIQLARKGDNQAATRILWQILLREPDNENAWLWLSQVQKGERQRLECLQHVLRINPDNHYARIGADYLNARLGNKKPSARSAGVLQNNRKPPRRNFLEYLFLTLLCVTLVAFFIRIIKN